MTMSDRLRLAMKAAGLNQKQLADAAGVKPPSVNGWLSGKAKFLRGENLLSAAAALGVSQQWLATGEGDMNPSSRDLHAPSKLSQNVTLDPDMVSETVLALQIYWRRRGKEYNIVTQPEDFVWAYTKRLALGDRPATADLIDFGAMLEQRRGLADGGVSRDVSSKTGGVTGSREHAAEGGEPAQGVRSRRSTKAV